MPCQGIPVRGWGIWESLGNGNILIMSPLLPPGKSPLWALAGLLAGSGEQWHLWTIHVFLKAADLLLYRRSRIPCTPSSELWQAHSSLSFLTVFQTVNHDLWTHAYPITLDAMIPKLQHHTLQNALFISSYQNITS